MTGYQSKKKAAQAKTIDEVNWLDHEPDGRRAALEPAQEKYTYGTPLLDAYTTPPKPALEQNFCPRCGKRTKDIHTCTPPQEKNT